ncbi:MAG: pyrroline-5-carboxylate reductase, partial [Bacteroidales bacterium]|nr:pyrroline-5-carboxylate reductase [Bacteroidales bacterium]
MSTAIITFIGGGNMARSLIGGLVQKGFDPAAIRVSEPLAEARDALATDFGVTVFSDNGAACAGADLVVLAVKPQAMPAVAGGLAPALGHRPVVVSIAAGIPVAALQQWLGANTPIIRCMPNTPALVHLGASGLFASALVSSGQKALAEQLFSAVGVMVWLDAEAEIDAVTALSGSGPAYFFLLMEAMQSAGETLGLSPATARQLTLQTALGAATMAAASDVGPDELRRRVTSPAGTTEKAIEAFMAGGLPALVAR